MIPQNDIDICNNVIRGIPVFLHAKSCNARFAWHVLCGIGPAPSIGHAMPVMLIKSNPHEEMSCRVDMLYWGYFRVLDEISRRRTKTYEYIEIHRPLPEHISYTDEQMENMISTVNQHLLAARMAV